MLEWIEYICGLLDIPTIVLIVLAIFFFILQGIGEIMELFGKVAPEIMKIRKYFERKKRERKTMADMADVLEKTRFLLQDVSLHYSVDNIAKRDTWMRAVDERLNESEKRWEEFGQKLDKNNSVTLSLLIENKRTWLLEFASRAADENAQITREEYRRFFKAYKEYEELIEENNLTNGETDIAHRIVVESYKNRMHHHSFIENLRGYEE